MLQGNQTSFSAQRLLQIYYFCNLCLELSQSLKRKLKVVDSYGEEGENTATVLGNLPEWKYRTETLVTINFCWDSGHKKTAPQAAPLMLTNEDTHAKEGVNVGASGALIAISADSTTGQQQVSFWCSNYYRNQIHNVNSWSIVLRPQRYRRGRLPSGSSPQFRNPSGMRIGS